MDLEYKIILWIGILVMGLILLSLLYVVGREVYRLVTWYLLPYLRNRKIEKIREQLLAIQESEDVTVSKETIEKWKQYIKKYAPVEAEEVHSLTMDDFALTKELENYIDHMIDTEVRLLLSKNSALREKFNVLNIDVYLKDICTEVVNGLNPVIFSSSPVTTEKYIMRYITVRANEKILDVVNSFNSVV